MHGSVKVLGPARAGARWGLDHRSPGNGKQERSEDWGWVGGWVGQS